VNSVCEANISNPLIDIEPPTGIPIYNNIYVSSIIHQQGINFGDTITLSRHWLARIAVSEDWTWVNSYTKAYYQNYAYLHDGVSPTASIMYKPTSTMTLYASYVNSIQAPDVAGASTSTVIYANANQAIPAYRSKQEEIGYKVALRKINFSTALFRLERPFANYVTVPSSVCGTLTPSQICQEYEIVGHQLNYGIETMLSGRIIESLMLTGGLVVLNPKLWDTGIPATNGMQFVGMPNYKSNILAEYRIPAVHGLFFNFDWQHVGRRPIDDVNSTWTTQYNVFDFGLRYSRTIMRKAVTWRITANNLTDVFYWSTLGPGSITGQDTGSYLGHLGDPRLVTASMRVNF
jgi:iron complex outermembrane receptor protein